MGELWSNMGWDIFWPGHSYIHRHYVVQQGDNLNVILDKCGMTKKEWDADNPKRRAYAVYLHPGETIVIKDPIETCKQRDNYLLTQELMISGKKDLESLCADHTFKPLEKFVEKLQK